MHGHTDKFCHELPKPEDEAMGSSQSMSPGPSGLADQLAAVGRELARGIKDPKGAYPITMGEHVHGANNNVSDAPSGLARDEGGLETATIPALDGWTAQTSGFAVEPNGEQETTTMEDQVLSSVNGTYGDSGPLNKDKDGTNLEFIHDIPMASVAAADYIHVSSSSHATSDAQGVPSAAIEAGTTDLIDLNGRGQYNDDCDEKDDNNEGRRAKEADNNHCNNTNNNVNNNDDHRSGDEDDDEDGQPAKKNQHSSKHRKPNSDSQKRPGATICKMTSDTDEALRTPSAKGDGEAEMEKPEPEAVAEQWDPTKWDPVEEMEEPEAEEGAADPYGGWGYEPAAETTGNTEEARRTPRAQGDGDEEMEEPEAEEAAAESDGGWGDEPAPYPRDGWEDDTALYVSQPHLVDQRAVADEYYALIFYEEIEQLAAAMKASLSSSSDE